jgi:hypothetical protein
MFKILKQEDPIYTASEEDSIIKKAKIIIEQANTREQLKIARKFIDLFIKNDQRKYHIRDELIQLWMERDKFLFQE